MQATTRWALGFISTVRIGAGAWRKLANTRQSGDTDQAKTQFHHGQRGPEQKGKSAEASKKRNRTVEPEKNALTVKTGIPPLSRATPLHSVALRAGTSKETKKLMNS